MVFVNERISKSQYKNKFILKGGILIAAIVGIDSRSTMDMDATIKGYPINEEALSLAIKITVLVYNIKSVLNQLSELVK